MSDQKLNLERIFGDPDINGDAPISLKFSADGRYVSFLKSNANNVEQLKAEQSAAYKPKVQKSAYLQSLTNNSNSTNNNSNSSDSRKHISIENVNFKSDNIAQSFEQMMELAG